MRLRIMSWAVAVLACGWVAGCGEPTGISPVFPPGLDPPRVGPIGPDGGAQALGEQPAAEVKQNTVPDKQAAYSPPTEIGHPVKTASGLVYETLQSGDGLFVKSGQEVKIKYSGTLPDGSTFDSGTISRRIGPGSRLIEGWNEGVPGMRVGERRKLICPPELAYGPNGNQGIPGNTTLTFIVEMIEAK